MLQDIKTALKQPLQMPQINLPVINIPTAALKDKNPDFIEGFLLNAAFDLGSFPVDIAQDLIHDFGDQLKQTRRRLRQNQKYMVVICGYLNLFYKYIFARSNYVLLANLIYFFL